jgi:hypothetical protein
LKTPLKISLLCIAALSLTTLSCGPKIKIPFNCITYHNPIVEFTVLPNKETIKVGDTLVLACRSSTLLNDWANGEEYNFINDSIFPMITMYELKDSLNGINLKPEGVSKDFKYITEIGELYFGNLTHLMSLKKTNDSLFFKVKIAPEKVGLFSLNLFHSLYFKSDLNLPKLSIKDGPDDKCKHLLRGVLPRINSGNYTVDRANKKGFEVESAAFNGSNNDLKWMYHKGSYYFNVEP